MIQCISLIDIRTTFADHDTKLDFPISLFRAARDDNIIIRANYRGRPFVENNGFRGHI